MGRRILLLDDDPQFRELMSLGLRHRGHSVVEVGTAQAASEAVAAQLPDIAIVDGLLPDQDGASWIAGLRRAGHLSTQIIFVSALQSDPATTNRLTVELAVSRVLVKPFTPDSLADHVEALATVPRPTERAGAKSSLQKLHEIYQRALPGKGDEIAAAAEKARSSPDPVAGLRMLAHRLHGTAASYGFPGVGEAAGRLEVVVARGLDAARGTEVDWGAADEALALLRTEITAATTLEAAPVGHGAAVREVRVLVVDDDPAFLAFAQAQTRRGLATVLVAATAEDALGKARSTQLDGALIDIHLTTPGAGIRLVEQVRRLPGCADLPIALISGDTSLSNRLQAAQAGVALLLTKPITDGELADAIGRITSMRSRERGRVVVVDDDVEFAQGIAATLEADGLKVTHVAESSRLLESLEDAQPDVLLLDVMMTPFNGFELCRMLRISPRWQDLPILFLTGATGADARLQAFRAGGDDFILKPVVTEELLARVRLRLDRARLIRERFHVDALTGLLLRRPLLEALSSRLAEAERHRRIASLALLDIDHFKRVNDTQGHLAGDQVLATLGRLLLDRFRHEDLRARWGGEEFVLVFPGESSEKVKTILERVLTEFHSLEFEGSAGRFSCSFTAGVASFPSDGATTDGLLKVADRRLYAGKEAGRSRVVITDVAVSRAEQR